MEGLRIEDTSRVTHWDPICVLLANSLSLGLALLYVRQGSWTHRKDRRSKFGGMIEDDG